MYMYIHILSKLHTQVHVNETCKRKEERSTEDHTNNKESNIITHPRQLLFQRKNELPQVGVVNNHVHRASFSDTERKK